MNRLFRLATRIALRMPRRWLEFIVGTVMLRWAFLLYPPRKRLIRSHHRRILAHAGAEASPERLDALFAETQALYARLLLCMLCRPEDLEFARSRVDLAAVLPELEKGLAKGKGVVLACNSFGLYVAAIQALLLRGFKLRIPVLNRLTADHMPLGWPEIFLTVGRASAECLQALERNEIACVVTMINYMTKRPTLELFGAPARVAYAPARLAAASGAPILPIFAVFEEESCLRERCTSDPQAPGAPYRARCRVQTEGLLWLDPGPRAVEETTQRLIRVQERFIARYPGQWLVYEDLWNPQLMDAKYQYVRWLLRWFF